MTSAAPALTTVQRRRKLVIRVGVAAAVALFSVLSSTNPPGSFGHDAIEVAGLGLILLCIAGRCWCALYIGGRKRYELVSVGPYSVMRNPLYVFSLLGAAGVGLSTGSVAMGLVAAVAAFLVFRGVVRSEEAFLADTFGEAFKAYAARVPRWLPRLSGWQDVPSIAVDPRLVTRTFCDACFFLLAIPVCEAIDWLQAAGILPVLLRLP